MRRIYFAQTWPVFATAVPSRYAPRAIVCLTSVFLDGVAGQCRIVLPLMLDTVPQTLKKDRSRRAAALKADRQARAGLSRTLKVRVYPVPAQATIINRTIGITRFVWNVIWLPIR